MDEQEPIFPTAQNAQEVHDQSIQDFEQPHAPLLDQGKLEGALGRAQQHYHYTEGTPDERMAAAAGALAHGIGAAQAFEDGNKRTAFHTTRGFLHTNGYPQASPEEDTELADHLIGHGEGTHTLEDTQNLFRQRMGLAPRWGRIVATQDEESWFEDYLRVAIADYPAHLPPRSQKVGSIAAEWFDAGPGEACITVEGGNADNRAFAEELIRVQLEGHGITQASYSIDWDGLSDEVIKEAGVHYSTWQDIEAKAKRLIQSGSVQILRNGANIIVGQVQGDHGNYQTEISRDDPNSQSISLWQCECKWDQFAWQRTRQWKKYEGRVCAHVLATWWLAQTLPLDEEYEPGGQPEGGGTGGEPPSPIEQPIQATPDGSGMVPPATAPQPQQPAPQNTMAPPTPNAPVPGQAPAPDLMPQYPQDPALQPAVNPVSVPGQKPQTPLNPIQNPGGTFSSIHESEQAFINGQMIQLKNEDVGQTVGLNAGQQATVPANSIGEVLGTDPITKMVNVYYAGPQAEAGIMEPHGIAAWHWPADVIPRPDVRPPGPAVRRRS